MRAGEGGGSRHVRGEMTSTHTVDRDGFIPLGEVARGRLGEQCQYVARYVAGNDRLPALGQGLRITGTLADYHAMRIHSDDADEFVARVRAHWRATGRGG